MLADPMATGGRARRLAGSSYRVAGAAVPPSPGNLSRGRGGPFPGSALTLVLLVALLCLGSAPAPVLADSFTVRADQDDFNPDTIPKLLDSRGDTGTVEALGVLRPAQNAGHALTLSHVVTADIAGTVATTGVGQHAVFTTNLNAEDGARLTLGATGTIITTGARALAVFNQRDDFTLDMQGGRITTAGFAAEAVGSSGANFTFTMADGTISTQSRLSHAVNSVGANFQFTMRGGNITTVGREAHAVYSQGETFRFDMQGGSIETNGRNAHAIRLNAAGNLVPGEEFEHEIKIGAGASVTAKGEAADAIYIENNAGTSRTRVSIAGTVTAEGRDGVALNIADTVELVITGAGKVEAKENATKAIVVQNDESLTLRMSGSGKVIGIVELGGGADSITLADTASITGNIDMGAGADELTLNGGTITGTIRMGLGNDTLTFGGTASRVNGVFANGLSTSQKKAITVIDMGAGDDTVTLASLANIPFGLIDGGAHDVADTIDLSALVKRVRSSQKGNLDIAWINFEHETGLVDDSPEAKEPEAKEPEAKEPEAKEPEAKEPEAKEPEAKEPEAKEPEAKEPEAKEPEAKEPEAKEPEAKEPEAKEPEAKEPEAKEPEAKEPEAKAGAGEARQVVAEAGPGRVVINQKLLDEAGPYVIGINIPGQADFDPKGARNVVTINPTGQAVEARAMTGLTDALHDLGGRRLGGSTSSQRRAGRPLQVAASGRVPGLLFRDTRPYGWSEVFGMNQRRAADGFASAYGMHQKGVALGIEQDFRGGRDRLGVLFGYARTDFKTRSARLASVKTVSHSGFAGVYGRRQLEDVYVQGGLNASYSKHDNRRRVLNQVAKGKYASWGLSPSLTVGRAFPLAGWFPRGEFSVEPSVDVRYNVGFYDSYREKGLSRNSLVIKRRLQQSVSGRLNLAGIYALPDEGGSVSLRLGVSHRRLFSSDLEGRVADRAFKFKSAGSNNVTQGYAGVDIAINMTDRLSVTGRYEYSHSIGTISDRGNSGQLSLTWRF